MAASTYDAALARVLAHEGGYSNHPDDPGGPTKYGITLADYRRYVMPQATAADVKAMPLTDAKAIYRARYWDAQRCDDLPAGVDYAVFDYGVNSGIGRSGKVLRRVLQWPDVSSDISDGVIAAAQRADAKTLIEAICDERMRFLQSLKTWPVFGAGWGRRVAEVRSAALSMAAGTAPGRRGDPTDGRGVVPLNATAQRGSAGAVVIAGGAAVHQAQSGFASITAVLILVALTAALAVAAWMFWRWRQKHLQEKHS
jgi:lysozyme family protein